MATRFYFDLNAIPPSSWNGTPLTTPAVTSSWIGGTNHNSLSDVRSMITVIGTSTPLTALARTYDSTGDPFAGNALHRRYVSQPLQAQTIAAQTIKIQVQATEVRAANNLILTWKLFLVDTAGIAVVGGTILLLRADPFQVEFVATPATNRRDFATSTLVTALLNHRICLEVGASGTPNAGTANGHNFGLTFGTAGTADLPEDNTDITLTKNPWLEFGSVTTISFVAPAVPILRATQDTIEGLYDDGTTGVGTLRLTQDTIEGLVAAGPGAVGSLRATQDTIEGLYDEVPINIPRLFCTQDTIEGLWDEGAEPPPEEEQPLSCPEGQLYTARALAGQIRYAMSEEGQISTARAQAGQVDCG